MVDCNNCKHLNITEREQTNKKENHICLKYNKRVFHNANTIKHEKMIYPCLDCLNDSYSNYGIR